MSKKASLSFHVKRSLIVGTVGAVSLASSTACYHSNPVPPEYEGENANEVESSYEDVGDGGDVGEDAAGDVDVEVEQEDAQTSDVDDDDTEE